MLTAADHLEIEYLIKSLYESKHGNSRSKTLLLYCGPVRITEIRINQEHNSNVTLTK